MNQQSRFLLKKVGWALLTVFIVIVLNFFLFRVLPGDPARTDMRDSRLKPESIAALRARFGLDKPVVNCVKTLNPLQVGDCFVNPFETQFFIYMTRTLRGDMGISYDSNRPVTEILAQRLWNTLLLLGAGQILSIIIGVGLGVLIAWKTRSLLDYCVLIGSLTAWSLPTFWLGMILLLWGSSQLGLPLSGRTTAGASFTNTWETWRDIGRHLLLPTLTWTVVLLGQYIVIIRSAMLDVLNEDYILMARAKGLTTFQILKDHALRNTGVPIVTIIALNLGFTVSGSVSIETVFSWPGLGLTVIEAVTKSDFPVLQGAFLLITVSVVLANLLADVLYSYLDPRIQAI